MLMSVHQRALSLRLHAVKGILPRAALLHVSSFCDLQARLYISFSWQWPKCKRTSADTKGLLTPSLEKASWNFHLILLATVNITELKVKGLEYRPHFFYGRWCKIHMSESVTTGRGGQLETIMQSTSFIFISLQQIFMGYIIYQALGAQNKRELTFCSWNSPGNLPDE